MTWAALIPIIASQGLAIAEKIWQLSLISSTPTQADWDVLKELGKVRAVNLMRQAILRSGIDPESDAAKLLIAAATTSI